MQRQESSTKSFLIVGTLIVVPILIVLALIAIFNDNPPSEDVDYEVIEAESLQNRFSDLKFTNFEGKDVKLTKYKGDVIVANAWAMWCPFCVSELPEFAKFKEELGDDIVVIAIDRGEKQEDQEIFIDQIEENTGVDFSEIIFLNDPNDDFYKTLGGLSMPETLIFDKAGNLVVHKRGPMELEEMLELSKRYL